MVLEGSEAAAADGGGGADTTAAAAAEVTLERFVIPSQLKQRHLEVRHRGTLAL